MKIKYILKDDNFTYMDKPETFCCDYMKIRFATQSEWGDVDNLYAMNDNNTLENQCEECGVVPFHFCPNCGVKIEIENSNSGN